MENGGIKFDPSLSLQLIGNQPLTPYCHPDSVSVWWHFYLLLLLQNMNSRKDLQQMTVEQITDVANYSISIDFFDSYKQFETYVTLAYLKKGKEKI